MTEAKKRGRLIRGQPSTSDRSTTEHLAAVGTTVAVKNFNAVDVARFVLAIFIVTIHTEPFSQLNETANFICTQILARVAVPFFFIAASYFFFRKIDIRQLHQHRSDADGRHLKKYIVRVVKLYGIWSALYLILFFYDWSQKGESLATNLFYLFRGPFVGIYYHLWFLSALILVILAVYAALRYVNPKLLWTSGLILCGLALLFALYSTFVHGGAWDVLTDLDNRYLENMAGHLAFGLLFVILGAILSQHRIVPRNKTILSLLFAAAMAAMFLGAFWLRKDGLNRGVDLTMAPAAVLLFLLLANIHLKDSAFIPYFRNTSLLIYLIHPLFIVLIATLTGWKDNLKAFLIVTACSILFSAILVLLSRKHRRFHFLTHLY